LPRRRRPPRGGPRLRPPAVPAAAPVPTPVPARPVLVARPAGRGASLLQLLGAAGIAAVHEPLVHLAPATSEELTAARERLAAGGYTHLVVERKSVVEGRRS